MLTAGTALGGNAASQIQPAPELGRLKFAAERIGMLSDRVSEFLARYHGNQPSNGAAAGGNTVEVSCYRNDLESVFAQLERLEQVVSALGTIG